ncbi:hypothetical protein V8F33_003784 [Rhypophila sp. PSN 637]
MDGRRTNRVTRSQASADANQANQTSSNVPDQPSATPPDAQTAEDSNSVAKTPSTLPVVTRVERTFSTLYRPPSSPTGQSEPLMGGSQRKALPDFVSPPGPPFRRRTIRSESPDSPPTPIRSKNTRLSGPPVEVSSSLQSPFRAVQDSPPLSVPLLSAKTSGKSQGKESEVLSRGDRSVKKARPLRPGSEENFPPRPQPKSAFQPEGKISGAMGHPQQKKGHPKQKLPAVRTQEEVARGFAPPFNPTSTAVSPSTAPVPTQDQKKSQRKRRLNMDDTKDEQAVKRQQKDTGKALDSDSGPVAQERNTGAVEDWIQASRNALATQSASSQQAASQNQGATVAHVPHLQQEPPANFRNPQSEDLSLFMGAREDGSLFPGLEADQNYGPDGNLLVPQQEEEIDELTAIRNLQRRILEATNNFTSGNFPTVDETWVSAEDPDRGVADLGEADVISEHIREQHPVGPEISNFLNGFCVWGTCNATAREGCKCGEEAIDSFDWGASC